MSGVHHHLQHHPLLTIASHPLNKLSISRLQPHQPAFPLICGVPHQLAFLLISGVPYRLVYPLISGVPHHLLPNTRLLYRTQTENLRTNPVPLALRTVIDPRVLC